MSLSDGGKRVVSWLNPHKSHKPIISGPVILKKSSIHDKAHVANMSGKAHMVVSYPVGLGVCVHNDQRESVVGESSRLPTMSSGVSAMPVAPTRVVSSLAYLDQAPVRLTAKPAASHPDRKGDIAAPSTTMESRHPGNLICVGARSNRAQGPQWEDSNRFSLLSNLDREGDAWSEEEEKDVFTESHPEVNDRGVSQTGSLSSGTEHVDGLHFGGSKLLLLPWEQSKAVHSVSRGGKQVSGPMECVPLSRWDPKAVKDKVLTMVDEEGEQSLWISTLMRSFCKLVGFPIVRHEAQCVALFRLLEQDCLEVANEGSARRPIKSGQKGLRELQGLVSIVNYDGSSSRFRGSSNSLGVIGSFK